MACPEGGISLAFHYQLAPFFYTGVAGNKKGVYYDFWEDVSRLAKCQDTSYRFDQYNKSGGVYEELRVKTDIRYGAIFSTVQPTYFYYTDPKYNRYTTLATKFRVNLLEKSELTEHKSTFLWFFIVFPLEVLLLILIAKTIIHYVESYFKITRSGRLTKPSVRVQVMIGASDWLRYVLFAFPFVFLVLQWQGYFQGNNLISVTAAGTSFSTMVAQFARGKRQLVVDTYEPLFDDPTSSAIFGGNSSFLYGNSVRERFQLVCEESSRVGVFLEFEYIEYLANREINEQCGLTEIKLSKGESTGVDWLNQAMLEGRPYTYLMTKNGTRKMRDVMNYILLTVYSEDNVNFEFLPRNLPIKMSLSIERRNDKKGRQLKQEAVSLNHLQPPIAFLAFGLISSLFAFVIEFLHNAWKAHISCCGRKLYI